MDRKQLGQDIINREAADKSKGFRLQKIRAIKLILETICKDPNAHCYTAIEHIEDIYLYTAQGENTTSYVEENKNYNAGSFTLNSKPVLNTLVSFFDSYMTYFRSRKIYFGFYTTRNIGKEKKLVLDDGIELELPEKPILFLLQSKEKLAKNILVIIKKTLIKEYIDQYSEKKLKGYYQDLIDIDLDEFSNFLGQINWYFSKEDDIKLKGLVIEAIKQCPFYDTSHERKEELIFSALMEILDEKQNKKDMVEKLTSKSDIEIVFLKAKAEPIEDIIMDPLWEQYKELETDIIDKRNLEEKIKTAVIDYPKRNMDLLARKACASKLEQKKSDRSFLSAKYRVFEACDEYMLSSEYDDPSTREDLDREIRNLILCSNEAIEELKKDYKYSITNTKSIEGMVLDLVDGCFLAFDLKQENNGNNDE